MDLACARAAGPRSAREAVALSVHGDDELGMSGHALQLLAQRGDVHIDRAALGQCLVAPDLVQQLVAREQSAAMLDEIRQELELHPRERDHPPPLPDLRTAE